jgi:hypothetical protein
MSCDLVDSAPQLLEITKQATSQYHYACELPYAPLSNVVERYVSILESEQFQAALIEATEFKRSEIINFRKMLGRISAVKSLNKFT